MEIIEGEYFEGNGEVFQLEAKEYLECEFNQIIFPNDIREIQFSDCTFNQCDLSSRIIERTGFKSVEFKDCKLLGLHFERCNTFLLEMKFQSCQLNMSSFYGLNLKNTQFEKCILQEVDFADSNLEAAMFSGSDLASAIFDNTNLSKADFRNAINYQLNPASNNIKKAKFSRDSIEGLLSGFDIILE